jgi:1-acyl-sn-glycerol-3-phosphate acyltransferase
MPHSSFIPPKPSPAAIAVGRAILSPALRLKYDVVGVDIAEEDLQRLRRIRNERALIAPNHPSNAEPAILFRLSQRVDEPFYYVCCREAFDHLGGVWGRFLQKVGGYSIIRGVADRDSFRMTRSLLCRPGAKVVIFPEGEVYSQNDTLLPFQSGVIQLMFWALEDIRKKEPNGSLYLVPVAIKYRFVRDMCAAILDSLDRLDRALALKEDPKLEPYPRLRRIGSAVLAAMERDYGLKVGEDHGDMNDRIVGVKEALIRRVASALNVEAKPDERNLSQRMRSLINAVHEVTEDETPIGSEYEARLREAKRERALPLLNDLDRLANLIAIQDGYVGTLPTPERMADTLRRLETEVLGEAICTGLRRCRVRVGEPFDLAEHLADYSVDKRATVRTVTARLEEAVQGLLNEMVLPTEAHSTSS